MSKANPDRIMRFALKLAEANRDRKACYAAMRREFPRIAARKLHDAYRDAKIWLAIKQVTTRQKEFDA